MVWTLFDSEFNLVKSSSGMLRVPDAPNKTGSFLSLSDLTGKVIFKKFIVSKEEEMDFNGRQPGIYLIRTNLSGMPIQ